MSIGKSKQHINLILIILLYLESLTKEDPNNVQTDKEILLHFYLNILQLMGSYLNQHVGPSAPYRVIVNDRVSERNNQKMVEVLSCRILKIFEMNSYNHLHSGHSIPFL